MVDSSGPRLWSIGQGAAHGKPTVNVQRREVSTDSLEMLKQDQRGEQHAIDSYKERIAQAESLREYGLRRVLEDILIQQEEQKRELLTAIDG